MVAMIGIATAGQRRGAPDAGMGGRSRLLGMWVPLPNLPTCVVKKENIDERGKRNP
jgi:hypothetical protein